MFDVDTKQYIHFPTAVAILASKIAKDIWIYKIWSIHNLYRYLFIYLLEKVVIIQTMPLHHLSFNFHGDEKYVKLLIEKSCQRELWVSKFVDGELFF